MKISDLLQESQQLDELTGKDIGRGVGKVAQGIGAVAGGVAGIPSAVKQGFQKGKAAVASTGTAAQPNAAAKSGGIGQAVDAFKKGFAQGKGTVAGDDSAANVQKTVTNGSKAGQEIYNQLKSTLAQLDDYDKKRIITLVQQSRSTAKPTQAELDADRNRLIGKQIGSDSIIRNEPAIKG